MTKTTEINARGRIFSLIFLPDGEYLLSAGDEGMIRQWRVDDGVEVGEGMKTGGTVIAMDISGDGKWIVSCGERSANVWSMMSRQIVVTVNEHSNWVDTIHVSPDSTRFATGSNDERAFIWDISTGKRLVGPLKHKDRVGVVRFSPDGERLATGTALKGLRIYNAHNGELLRTIPVLLASYPSNIITWFSSWTMFALVSRKIVAHIDVNTGQTLFSQTVPGDPVEEYGFPLGSITSSHNGKFIVSSCGSYVSLWDTSTTAQIADIQCNANLWTIALSPGSECLAISDANSKIVLRKINDVASNYYLVDQDVTLQPQSWSEHDAHDIRSQIEALQGKLHAVEWRIDELGGTSAQPSGVEQAVPLPRSTSGQTDIFKAVGDVVEQPSRYLGIPSGDYRIKSKTNGQYITCLQQDTGNTVVMRPSDETNACQRWTISLVADGAYNIMCRADTSDILLGVGNGNALVGVPGFGHVTWTIEPRGDAFVIGNSGNATAIHLRKRQQGVCVSVRNNGQNQRWVLERVTN